MRSTSRGVIWREDTTHRQNFDPLEVQRCTLLSIKTGGCNEDCKYCAQSTRYKTPVKPTPMMSVDAVVEAATRAKEAGSTRFCMGTAWRELGNKKGSFGKILSMVEQVNGMGLEVCCTLGMVNERQAKELKAAGLTAYNHNLDTSREHYPSVISTRTYDDRLQTIKNVRAAGISVCCGGILGIGESEDDRIGLLHELATMEKHPESVPVNALVPIEGTPMMEAGEVPDVFQMARTIATARVIMPRSMVRVTRHGLVLGRRPSPNHVPFLTDRLPPIHLTHHPVNLYPHHPGAPLGRSHVLLPDRADRHVHGGRQLHLHRRQAAHHPQPRL